MISLISTRSSLLCRFLGPITNIPQMTARSSCNRVSLVYAAKSYSKVPDGPPKVPATGYVRFLKQQHLVLARQYPDIKSVDRTKRIAQQWQALTPQQRQAPDLDQKGLLLGDEANKEQHSGPITALGHWAFVTRGEDRPLLAHQHYFQQQLGFLQPFEQAAQAAREKYKEEMKQFQAQLTPEQSRALLNMKREKRDRRKAIRMKREQTRLGKPKRPRTAFNIFMSEHMAEARGLTNAAKMKSLIDDYARLDSSLKKTYQQLAQDDKVRYTHEMESWEKYMEEIGREDLVRRKARSKKTAGATKDKAVQADMTRQKVTKSARLKRPEE